MEVRSELVTGVVRRRQATQRFGRDRSPRVEFLGCFKIGSYKMEIALETLSRPSELVSRVIHLQCNQLYTYVMMLPTEVTIGKRTTPVLSGLQDLLKRHPVAP